MFIPAVSITMHYDEEHSKLFTAFNQQVWSPHLLHVMQTLCTKICSQFVNGFVFLSNKNSIGLDILKCRQLMIALQMFFIVLVFGKSSTVLVPLAIAAVIWTLLRKFVLLARRIPYGKIHA